ncbi:tautomerase-like protein [Rhizobium azibense]|uniref:Tautomerase-like protein n=1 Tax=Rhizobium azibense TaxID=1136135 RepID=A0A4R3R5M3_9HYPH|nr:tautomerase-like protein [Rhizobium azibense]
MPFVNIKTPEGALNRAQKQEVVHCFTNMIASIFQRPQGRTQWC